MHAVGGPDVRREAVGQQLGDERARDDHALVDVEAEVAEPRLVREVGGGHALVDAAREQLRERLRARPASAARRETARAGRAAGAARAAAGTRPRRRRRRCRGRTRAWPRRSATRRSAASRAASRARWPGSGSLSIPPNGAARRSPKGASALGRPSGAHRTVSSRSRMPR